MSVYVSFLRCDHYPCVLTDTLKLSLPHSMGGAAAGFDDGHKVLEVSTTDTV